MTILKIFKPEDFDEVNAITTLSEGEHFVGREKLSDCHDKRVSRKHALIQVREDGVTLTSVHVNPCYFKSSNANNIQLIRKDSTVTLNNGDQFALLIDMFWYKVKVILSSNPTIDASTSRNTLFSTEQVKDALKRILDHSGNDDVCKRLKTSNAQEQVLPSTRTSHNIPSISMPNIDTSGLISNLNTIINEDYNNTTIQNRSISEERNENVNPENSRINIELPATTSENNDLMSVVNVHSNRPAGNTSDQPTETPNDNHAVPRMETELTNENANVTREIPSGESVPTDIPIQTIKKEIVESDSISENVKNTNIQLSPSTSVNLSNSILSAENIKTEAPDGENVEVKTDNTGNCNTSTVPNNGLSTENIKKEAPDKKADGPCSSNDSNTNTRRDRCWYAESCYRKNPIHRSDLSHPGDEDYDSDPNDDRQVCPFGAACYRVNMEHRRKFKHYGRPAPKPNNVRVQINVNSACPFCSHCSNNCRKPGYESDHDSDGGNEL